MCVHPTTYHKLHKVHTVQVYYLVAQAPIQRLAYKLYIPEG